MGAGNYRGFIEYIPGAFGWRAVFAEDYMLIHCLWVMGLWAQIPPLRPMKSDT